MIHQYWLTEYLQIQHAKYPKKLIDIEPTLNSIFKVNYLSDDKNLKETTTSSKIFSQSCHFGL